MNYKIKWQIAVLPLVLLICLLSFFITAEAEENTERIIRVGYPIQEGFTEKSEEGIYSGYTYEYLQEIAQYTNWEYEYVTPEGELTEQLTELLTMLQNGEIDVMGAMNYSESLALVFSYPKYSYGTTYSTLAVLQDNLKYTEFDYGSFDEIRVAVVSYDGQEDRQLNEFAAMNGFRVEQILCSTDEEQVELLKEGRADALLRMDVSLGNSELRVISRYSSKPFYFAVAKGKDDITGGLNRALEMINATNPYLQVDLYKKYFSGTEVMILSESEQKYIEQAGVLKAGVMLGNAPFQYRGSDGEVCGISIEVLQYITEQTGLKFEILPFDSWDAYSEAQKAGEIDVVVGVADEYDAAKIGNYTPTTSYLQVPLQLVMNQQVGAPSLLEGKKLAIEYALQEENPLGISAYYSSIEECLEAVQKGETDYCYGNSYSIQYYMARNKYKNLITIFQSEGLAKRYSFGIQKPVDITLLSILNKVISTLPEERVSHYLYENAFDADERSFIEYVQRNPQQSLLYLALILLAVIIILLVCTGICRRKDMARKALENQRYEQLSGLSNEFLYEYDFKEDSLLLTEQAAEFLGCVKKIEHPEVVSKTFPVIGYMISQKECSAEHECLLPTGSTRWLRFISKVIFDTAGRPWYAVGKLIDIQKEREIKEQLESRAQRDSMTGVYNSATSRQLIREALNEESRAGSGAMIIMDIDNFKQVNDDMGHYTGDQVLCETADILKACFREEDIVGRLGGDEFVVFMKSVTEEELVRQRCLEALSKVRDLTREEHGKEITLSIGASMAGTDKDYDTLYRAADQALYKIKNHGRNGVEIVV